MDHLVIPAGATHIRVPYKCTELYDGGNFFDYPTRKGWTKEQLLGQNKFGGRSDEEVEAFFQTWLYFGTLTCLFKLQGIDIDPSEFLTNDEQSREVFVTTSEILANKIQAWRITWRSSNKHRDCEEAKTTQKILTELGTYIDRYCGVEGREHEGIMRAPTTAPITWPVAGEIAMSMIALGYILGEALRDIYKDGRVITRWGASPLLKARLLENGWCALDVRRLLADVGIDGQYYLALKEFPYDKERHRGCTEFVCSASTVNEETYVTQHVQSECKCKDDMATKDVVEVIQNGGIPVVSWRKIVGKDGSGFVVEDAGKGDIAYVAVSHVWADGLGNPYENSLPVCQLERIQARVDAASPETERRPVCFWMDTLCIPVADEYKPLRKKSVQMMRQIYRRAGAVLVFDAGLQQLPIASTNNEKAMTVYMSNWLHRLWTFQEGMLAKKLCFQLKDGVLHAQDFVDDSVKEQEADQERGLYGSFQFTARSAALGHFVILRDFVEMKLAGNGVYFPPFAHAIHQRTTTRISDEAICAATILDMNMDDILAVKTDDVPIEVVAAERMEIFLKQVGEFAPGIIFHHQKRLRTEGYRWAPKTIMGAPAADFARDLNEKLSSFNGKGLRVRYPGFIIENILPGSGEEITVMFKHDEHQYRLQLFPEDEERDSVSLVWDPNAVYAVVMFRSISSRYTTGTDAIVGILKDPTAVHEEQLKRRRGVVLDMTVNIRCECRAWVEPLDLAPSGVSRDSTALAELLGEKQKWRVF